MNLLKLKSAKELNSALDKLAAALVETGQVLLRASALVGPFACPACPPMTPQNQRWCRSITRPCQGNFLAGKWQKCSPTPRTPFPPWHRQDDDDERPDGLDTIASQLVDPAIITNSDKVKAFLSPPFGFLVAPHHADFLTQPFFAATGGFLHNLVMSDMPTCRFFCTLRTFASLRLVASSTCSASTPPKLRLEAPSSRCLEE